MVLHKLQYLTINWGCLSLSDPAPEIMNGFRQLIEEAIALLGTGNTDEIWISQQTTEICFHILTKDRALGDQQAEGIKGKVNACHIISPYQDTVVV